MALADELTHLRRELAEAGTPLQRMKMLARSWRTLRRLDPDERRQLATAVGADGAEDILEKLAARKGRVGPSILLPALEKLKEMDSDALGRLIDTLRDPEQRREVMLKSARAFEDVVIDSSADEPVTEATPVGGNEVEIVPETGTAVEAAPEPNVEAIVVAEPGGEPEPTEPPGVETHPAVDESDDDQLLIVEPEPEELPPVAPPVPLPPSSLHAPPPVVPHEEPPDQSRRSLGTQRSTDLSGLDRVRAAKTLARRLTTAREVLDDARGWNVEQLQALIELFPQQWARRRILADLLTRGIPEGTDHAIHLVGSLESRASRRWCVSLMLHEWTLSDDERQLLRSLI